MSTRQGTIKNIGLTTTEANKRLGTYGENIVFKRKKTGPLLIFLRKLGNPLFILMIIISIVSFTVGQRTSALIVIVMIFFSVILDFFNTYKSQKTIDRLNDKISTLVTVIRDAKKQDINLKEVVPGDLISLSAGDIIPADCQVLTSDDFFVNQSALTGESIPVEKIPQTQKQLQDSGPENIGLIFMGTSVISGFATACALKTGAQTEFGKIAQALGQADPKTDFEINIMKFSIFIMKLVFFMAGFVFIVYLIKNGDNLNRNIILEAFTFALAITIGVTPDMLPAIITICLNKGSQLMAKKNVIVKHLTAIENFGSMDVLCTDKTGTLTQDHIALIRYIDGAGQDSQQVLEFGYLSSLYHTGVKNPLDEAIKNFKKLSTKSCHKIDEIPYDFQRKRGSMVVDKNQHRYLLTKGAPEEIFKISKYYTEDGKIIDYKQAKKKIEKQFEELSLDGFRVLALCYKELPHDQVTTYDKKIEQEMIFIGFMAFLDPPKEGVKQTIDELEQLGIEIKVLTGDNELLTQKICRDIGLAITGVITGQELKKMSDFELDQSIKKTNIFARITPDQKERIILSLKRNGKAVGFLGDGINDTPAMKIADVGISVNNAVDIARYTADIILMEKSLESLKDGVIEGRKTFHNTLKYVLMGLSSNFGNMFSMMGAATFLPFLPMLPSQILFNNLIYDVSQFSLPTDAVDEDELIKPAHWDLKFIRKYMFVFGLMSSIFDFLTFFLLYSIYHLSEHQFQTGWFIESIATQIFVIYVIRTKKIPFFQSSPSKTLFVSTLITVIFAWSIQFTPLGAILEFDKLPFKIMAIIFSYVLIYLVLVQLVKQLFYWHHRKKIKKQHLISVVRPA